MKFPLAICITMAAASISSVAGTTGDRPPRDVGDAIIFTMQEMTDSDYGLDLARKAGSEVLIRGWFKWNQAPRCDQWRTIPEKAHAMGALFGCGITCSALYDGENGITREQLLDMATRGPDGQLVDAWGNRGIRHGSLSSPAYLDYLFRWCREQIDAGVDYLFMDEINAALGPSEGFDDHSLADYRTYLREHGLPDVPHPLRDKSNPHWPEFRTWRDDRAWKSLTDRIRAYAKERGRTVLISGNGLAKYVDLQVLGVWDRWAASAGHIDLRENQLANWRSLVERGQVLAGKSVPVVFFHDWGFGNPPFPFLAVPPSERAVWMRTRGAEIFAAGARFAFPVLGPFGCDAKRDGTLDLIGRQAAFYRDHRDLYLRGDFLGCDPLHSLTPNLSLAAWSQRDARTLVLHIVNRNLANGALLPQTNVCVRIPLDRALASATAVSPDFAGERIANCRLAGNALDVTLDHLDAYSVAILRFDRDIDLRALRDPIRTAATGRWERPNRNEFRVRSDGLVEDAEDLNSFIQGMLHKEMRNPPTFLVNAKTESRLLVHVRAVSSAGANLEYKIDGETKQVVNLPDLDHKNDEHAPEYDKTFIFAIPAGHHRLTLDNTGADWAAVTWFAFDGNFAPFDSADAPRE